METPEEKEKTWNRFPPFRVSSAIVASLGDDDSDDSNKADRVAKQFWPIICILRVFGFYPISKQESPPVPSAPPEEEISQQTSASFDSASKILGSTKGQLGSKLAKCKARRARKLLYGGCFLSWKTKITLYSYAIQLFNLFCWVTFICNIGLGLPFPLDLARLPHDVEHASDHNSTLLDDPNSEPENRLVILAEGVIKFIEMFHLIVNSDLFTDWLNSWMGFERDFRKYFHPKGISFHFNVRLFCTGFLVFYSFLPSLIRLAMGISVSFHYWHNPQYLVLSYFVFIWIDILLVVHSLLEDSKTFLMLRSLQMSYEQVRIAINEDVTIRKIQAEDVTQWRKIVTDVRRQVALCSEYIKGRQLLILLDTIFVFSGGIFSILRMSQDGHNVLSSKHYHRIISSAILGVLCYTRLYVTVLLAEKTYQEEAQIAEDVLEMQTDCLEESTKQELKFLYSMVTEKPAIINLGNYINIDKKLIITMITNIVILLIAIMQFHGLSSN